MLFDEDLSAQEWAIVPPTWPSFDISPLNLVKSEKTAKVGVKNKRLKAGWDEDYLLKVVLGEP